MTTTNYDLYGMVDKVVYLDEELLRVDPEDVVDVRARDLLRPLLKQVEGVRLTARELEQYLYTSITANKTEPTKVGAQVEKSGAKKK